MKTVTGKRKRSATPRAARRLDLDDHDENCYRSLLYPFTEESPVAESLLWMIQSRSLSLTQSQWDTQGILRAGRGSRSHQSAPGHSGPRNLCQTLREQTDQHPCQCLSLGHQDNIIIQISINSDVGASILLTCSGGVWVVSIVWCCHGGEYRGAVAVHGAVHVARDVVGVVSAVNGRVIVRRFVNRASNGKQGVMKC